MWCSSRSSARRVYNLILQATVEWTDDPRNDPGDDRSIDIPLDLDFVTAEGVHVKGTGIGVNPAVQVRQSGQAGKFTKAVANQGQAQPPDQNLWVALQLWDQSSWQGFQPAVFLKGCIVNVVRT